MRIKFISGSSGGWDVPEEAWAWRMEENAEGRGMQTFDHGHHMWSIAWFFMREIERVCAWIDSYEGAEYSRKQIAADLERHGHRRMVTLDELRKSPCLL